MSENANATRQRVRQSAVDVPDIRLKACADLLGSVLCGHYPYGREVGLEVFSSGAALTIEHPGDARDDIALYTAGTDEAGAGDGAAHDGL